MQWKPSLDISMTILRRKLLPPHFPDGDTWCRARLKAQSQCDAKEHHRVTLEPGMPCGPKSGTEKHPKELGFESQVHIRFRQAGESVWRPQFL